MFRKFQKVCSRKFPEQVTLKMGKMTILKTLEMRQEFVVVQKEKALKILSRSLSFRYEYSKM